jgi:hypothetical protein
MFTFEEFCDNRVYFKKNRTFNGHIVTPTNEYVKTEVSFDLFQKIIYYLINKPEPGIGIKDIVDKCVEYDLDTEPDREYFDSDDEEDIAILLHEFEIKKKELVKKITKLGFHGKVIECLLGRRCDINYINITRMNKICYICIEKYKLMMSSLFKMKEEVLNEINYSPPSKLLKHGGVLYTRVKENQTMFG